MSEESVAERLRFAGLYRLRYDHLGETVAAAGCNDEAAGDRDRR